jgi:hypothetical protein
VEVNARARSEDSGLQETQNQAFRSHYYKNIPPNITDDRTTPDSDDSFDSGESEQSFWMPPLDEKVLFDSLERMKYKTIKSADVKLVTHQTHLYLSLVPRPYCRPPFYSTFCQVE